MGDRVTIETVSANLQRPEYQYVVRSPNLDQRFQLRAEDFSSSRPPLTSQPERGTQPVEKSKFTSVAKTIGTLFAIAFFILALVLGGVWWGWGGVLIGFIVWAVIWGAWLFVRDIMHNITDMGEAARKQLGRGK